MSTVYDLSKSFGRSVSHGGVCVVDLTGGTTSRHVHDITKASPTPTTTSGSIYDLSGMSKPDTGVRTSTILVLPSKGEKILGGGAAAAGVAASGTDTPPNSRA